MANVYIVQEPTRIEEGRLVSFMDFRPVLAYGDPIVCLEGNRVAFSPGPMISNLKTVLKNFCDDDYLVAVGDPSAIAAASVIAAKNNCGRINMLKWDRIASKYYKVALDFN